MKIKILLIAFIAIACHSGDRKNIGSLAGDFYSSSKLEYDDQCPNRLYNNQACLSPWARRCPLDIRPDCPCEDMKQFNSRNGKMDVVLNSRCQAIAYR